VQHRQDRALARIAKSIARITGAALHRVGELRWRKHFQMACAVAEPEQELREDRAGVAACAI